jgi:hypothetical protein
MKRNIRTDVPNIKTKKSTVDFAVDLLKINNQRPKGN